MSALVPMILKGMLFLFLFLIGLLLFLLLLLFPVLFRYRGSGAREEKQLSGCFSISWLFSPLRFNPSRAVERKAKFFVLGFHIHHSDGTEGAADTTEENDFNCPESMASEDFGPDTTEMAVAEQQKAITEQAEIPSEYSGVMEPVSNRKRIPPQREDKRRRNVPEKE